jgi:hypothetical protein
MLKTHDFKGYWWLPGEEDAKFSGDLQIERGGARLDVLGDFGHTLLSETPREKTYSLDPADQQRILGITADGKKVTLERVQAFGNSVSFPGLSTARYRAGVVIIGAHFDEGAEVLFDEIAIQATDLNAWTTVSGIKPAPTFEELNEEGGLGFVSVDVRYEGPEPISIPISKSEEMSIRFTATNSGLFGRSDHFELRQDAAIHVRFGKRVDLSKVFERVSQVRNFLSLAVGRPVSVVSVSGFRDDGATDRMRAPQPIEIYWEIPNNPDPPEKRRDAREMLFALPEAKPDISTVMKKWLVRQKNLEPVFNLFFGTMYHPSLYLEVRFLAYAQAIETYDYRRRRKPGRRHLIDRLRDVLARSRKVTKRIVGTTDDELEEFLARFRDTRNYYTHYNPRMESRAASGTALLLITLQLRAVIEMSLLRELGFPSSAIDETLERARRYEEISHFRAMLESEEQQ